MKVKPPLITLFNGQRALKPALIWLRALLKHALPACLAEAKTRDAPLCRLGEIEITLINDAEISRVHGEFLGDPTPTDVITFHHGEILISADTALRQGAENGQSLDRELALYAIHGLLHLAGWDDHDPAEAAAMAEIQERILARSLERMPEPVKTEGRI